MTWFSLYIFTWKKILKTFYDLFSFCSFGFWSVFNLLDPYLFVNKLAKNIKSNREYQAQQEKDYSLRQVKDIKNGINPNVGFVFNHMNPTEIRGHEDSETSETSFSTRIATERCKHFHNDENHDICVHNVIQPTEKIKNHFIKDSWAEMKWKTHFGKNASNAFGKTSSRSIANSVQKVIPTLKATGNAKVAKI